MVELDVAVSPAGDAQLFDTGPPHWRHVEPAELSGLLHVKIGVERRGEGNNITGDCGDFEDLRNRTIVAAIPIAKAIIRINFFIIINYPFLIKNVGYKITSK